MLATIIFGFIIVGATRSFQQTVAVHNQTTRQAVLRDKLQSQLSIIRVQRTLQEGEETTEPDDDGIYFETKVEPLEQQDQYGENIDKLYKVDIRVVWPLTKYTFDEASLEVIIYK
ncbi:MAG: hypothetical protein AAF984_10940 [Verrucomicrobiota bacterium]